jgi:FkbM family methyltransferase
MPLRFIDGGAYTGDTIEFLLDQGAGFEAIAAFEPDPMNFRELRRTVQRRRDALKNVSLWPCGTSDSTRLSSFRAAQGAASVVADDGENHVQLVALDEVLPDFAPSYIKLDIEGAELATLRGGEEMIHRHQPSLAICVYHEPNHLWDIPLYMRQILPAHRIALRYHGYQSFDVVAYALRVA